MCLERDIKIKEYVLYMNNYFKIFVKPYKNNCLVSLFNAKHYKSPSTLQTRVETLGCNYGGDKLP